MDRERSTSIDGAVSFRGTGGSGGSEVKFLYA